MDSFRHLLSDDVLAGIESPEPSATDADRAAMADPIAGSSLRHALLLDQFPDVFVRRGWPPEAILWSRYYWSRRFAKPRADRILEIDPGFDPTLRAIIDELADHDAGEQLRPRPAEPIRSHPIAPCDVDRLASIRGVTSLDDWDHHIAAEKQIPGLIAGEIRGAWAACLPAWVEQGRVCDLSRYVRVMMYRGSFAGSLGAAFIRRHWQGYPFFLELLDRHPIDSVEYLSAFDLLEAALDQFDLRGLAIPRAIFGSNRPLPPVIEYEERWVDQEPGTIGACLRLRYDEDHSPEDAGLDDEGGSP